MEYRTKFIANGEFDWFRCSRVMKREPSQTLRVREVSIILLTAKLFLLRSLSAVFGAGLFSVGYACSIQCTSDDMISGTRQVPNSSYTDQNNAVILKVVSLSRNVACYLDAVGKTNSGDLSKSWVRFLRGSSLNCCTNATFLRCGLLNCFLS